MGQDGGILPVQSWSSLHPVILKVFTTTHSGVPEKSCQPDQTALNLTLTEAGCMVLCSSTATPCNALERTPPVIRFEQDKIPLDPAFNHPPPNTSDQFLGLDGAVLPERTRAPLSTVTSEVFTADTPGVSEKSRPADQTALADTLVVDGCMVLCTSTTCNRSLAVQGQNIDCMLEETAGVSERIVHMQEKTDCMQEEIDSIHGKIPSRAHPTNELFQRNRGPSHKAIFLLFPMHSQGIPDFLARFRATL
jgi:hypothetical protein